MLHSGIEPWNEIEEECRNYMCTKMKILSIPVFGICILTFMDLRSNCSGNYSAGSAYGPAGKGWSRGRERIYFDRYGMTSQEIPASPTKPPETFRGDYAQRENEGWLCAVHRLFPRCEGQQIFEQTKLPMPVLAVAARSPSAHCKP